MSPKYSAKLYNNTRTYGAEWGECIYCSRNNFNQSPLTVNTRARLLRKTISKSLSDKSDKEDKSKPNLAGRY